MLKYEHGPCVFDEWGPAQKVWLYLCCDVCGEKIMNRTDGIMMFRMGSDQVLVAHKICNRLIDRKTCPTTWGEISKNIWKTFDNQRLESKKNTNLPVIEDIPDTRPLPPIMRFTGKSK